MRHSTFGRALVFLAGAAALLAVAACNTMPKPQQASQKKPPQSNTIVVKAKRIGGDIQSIPIAITALSQEQLTASSVGAPPPPPAPPPSRYWQPTNTSKFSHNKPNPVKITADEPVSTFSIDVDTASYGVVRNALNNGVMPQEDAVRVEEMVNYFDYAYPGPPDRKAPFKASLRIYPTPWNKHTQILHIGIKGFDLPKANRPPANLVFLIDTSGSMSEPNKMVLLKDAFRLLVDQLTAQDRVAVVTYAGTVGVALQPTPGSEKAKILAAIDALNPYGSTAGGEGIRVAYQLAESTAIKGGVNRVLLATDGDFNVGITDPKALESFIVGERDKGVELSCLGFGDDNYNDEMMQRLAQAGNGNAAFIDNIHEAHKVFVDQVAGTLFTIAKDVKIQIEFNPARIAEYRLIGYETRLLNRTDFNNDKVDAGDIGSGHTVTALYEITPVGSKAQMADPLRYAKPAKTDKSGEIAFLKIRYKLPGETTSHLITRTVGDSDVTHNFAGVSPDMRFAASVAGAAQLMRHDPYIKSFDYDRAIKIADDAKGDDRFGYRAEFVRLLGLAKKAAGMKPLEKPPAPQ